jgi:protein-tyrosine sulfotransferase
MKRILITGCQRSGTTLMGLILNSHPSILNLDEDIFVDKKQLSLDKITSIKLPEQSANVDYIKNELKPDAVIWMVRNPFDVIKSMMTLKLSSNRTESECWGATFSHVEINRMLQYLPKKYTQGHAGLLDLYLKSLAYSKDRLSEKGIILSSITCWVLKQECYQYLIDSGLSVYKLHYEDLVSSPKPVLAKLFDFIGIGWHDNLLKHHELHSGYSIGNTLNSRAIDQSSLFYSDGFFNDSELSLISELTESKRRTFHYPELSSNGEFNNSVTITDDSKVAYSPEWLLYWLSASINQKDTQVAVSCLRHLLKDYPGLPASISDQVCLCLENDWLAELLSSDSLLNLSIRTSKYLDKYSSTIRKAFNRRLAIKSLQWSLLEAYYNKTPPSADFITIYHSKGTQHPEVANALAFLIGHFGSSENIVEQWNCLIEMSEKYPGQKYIKDVATLLVNTLPKEVDGAEVLLSWFDEELSKPELYKLFYKLIHKTKVNLSSLSASKFSLNTYSDAYIAWRLDSDLLDSTEKSKFLDFKQKLDSSGFKAVDFEGEASIYVGPEKPKKLIVCFTGFGSMLMHPMSLIHGAINIDNDVGVLWLQDLYSKVFLSGSDGKGDVCSFTKELIGIVEQYGAETVSVIGSSGACYASLYFSTIYPVYRSVALSPYTFLAEEKQQDLMQRKFGPLFKKRVDIVKDMGEREPEIRSYYGENNNNDKIQSEHLLQRNNVVLIPVKGIAGHDLGDALVEMDHFQEIFTWATCLNA